MQGAVFWGGLSNNFLADLGLLRACDKSSAPREPGSRFASHRLPQNVALPTSEGGPGHRPAPAPRTSPSPCRELERNPAKVTVAPAGTISHFCGSSAQRSGAPRPDAWEGAMGSPILGRVLAPSWDGERVDCFPLPARLGWEAGEERGGSQVGMVASKEARREKCSKSFGCFSLPSPPSPAGEERQRKH